MNFYVVLNQLKELKEDNDKYYREKVLYRQIATEIHKHEFFKIEDSSQILTFVYRIEDAIVKDKKFSVLENNVNKVIDLLKNTKDYLEWKLISIETDLQDIKDDVKHLTKKEIETELNNTRKEIKEFLKEIR